MLCDGFDVRHHQSEGFVYAHLPLAQRHHRIRFRGVTGQVKPTQTFYAQDLSFRQHPASSLDGLLASRDRRNAAIGQGRS